MNSGDLAPLPKLVSNGLSVDWKKFLLQWQHFYVCLGEYFELMLYVCLTVFTRWSFATGIVSRSSWKKV